MWNSFRRTTCHRETPMTHCSFLSPLFHWLPLSEWTYKTKSTISNPPLENSDSVNTNSPSPLSLAVLFSSQKTRNFAMKYQGMQFWKTARDICDSRANTLVYMDAVLPPSIHNIWVKARLLFKKYIIKGPRFSGYTISLRQSDTARLVKLSTALDDCNFEQQLINSNIPLRPF